MNNEFYIGWEDKAAPGIAKTVRRAVVVLLFAAVLVPVVLAVFQGTIGAGVFEWGEHKNFAGIFQAQPYPHLLVPRPGNAAGQPAYSTYYLVAQWKFGLDPQEVAPFDGKPVTLHGTLIYREGQTMIEVVDHSIRITNMVPTTLTIPETVPLGRQTLAGEIVDSKCYLGVMNPGRLAPHRACAIRCISGGCPPLLLVRQKNGPVIYFLLVSSDGKPINKQVLDLVAEPVEITGEVERQGGLLILRANPGTYRKL